MRRALLILLMALCFFVPTNCISGHGRNDATSSSRSAVNQTGYHGPVKLGPLSINNRVGGIDFRRLWLLLGRIPAAPPTMYVCYQDPAERIYLVVERGADDPRLVRGLTLSRINVCPGQKIHQASGFSTWTTGKGIRLGNSAKDVVSRYGEPSTVWDRRTDRGFCPYPAEGKTSHMSSQERILVYLPKEGAPDTSHAFFGVRNRVVVWMTVSANE